MEAGVGSDDGNGGSLLSHIGHYLCGFPWKVEVGDIVSAGGNSCVVEVEGVDCRDSSSGADLGYGFRRHGEVEETVGNRMKARDRDEGNLDG